MKIKSLLNPFDGDHHGFSRSESPAPVVVAYPGSPNVISKRQKIPKDAPIFSDGNKVVGVVNYSPHEAGDNRALVDEHERFQVFPRGEIHQRGIRHIPYNSDKKDFLDKTGRDAFEGKLHSKH
jgi:hypothetical protein